MPVKSFLFTILIVGISLVCFSLPAMAESFTVVHISDSHITANGSHGANLSAIVAEINAMHPKPVFVLATGDLVEMGFKEEYAKYKEFVAPLTVPLYNVMGNHEAKWSNWGKSGLPKFLKQKPYYSFDQAGVHFVGLDSTMWVEHNGFIDQSELNWLKSDLEKVGYEKPVVLFYHHCPGFLPNELQLLKLLRPYNVRLALVGHSHIFRTWMRNGIHFQMAKGAMNDQGGYRILEFTDNEVKSYTKLVGQPRVADGVIPLAKPSNPVTLLQPTENAKIEGSIRVQGKISQTVPHMDKVECAIDGKYSPVTLSPDGSFDLSKDWDGSPGRHTLSIRATDSDGMEWYDSVTVLLGDGKREAWRTPVSGAIQRSITEDQGKIYFGTWGGNVYCLNADSGRIRWNLNLGADVISQPAIMGDRLFLGTTDGKILSIKGYRGEVVWDYTADGPIQGSPVIASDTVFVGSGDHHMYALNVRNGDLRWKFKTGGMIQSKPVVVKDTLCFGSWDQTFYAVKMSDGKLKWKTKIGELIYFSPANANPATDGNRIIITASPWHAGDPDLFCLDAETGKILWQRRNPGEKSGCAFNSPWIEGERFYIASLDGGLYCMSVADGKEIWRAEIGQATYDNSPVISDGKLYIGGIGGGLFCFDAATGKKEWSYSTGGGYCFATPTVGKDLIFVPSTDGSVTAVRREIGK